MVRLLVLFSTLLVHSSLCYVWLEQWYNWMPIDHFGYSDNRTFHLRYLINSTFWDDAHSGPIFFYCGNEGSIELFAQNTGFMWDIAPEFGAMVVFAEHRYYGKTLPFGSDSFKNRDNLGYLSSEQALADYAVLLRWIKKKYVGADKSKVVTFGGSYGGMLAAWFRMKYPHLVIGALAASAPVLQFTDVTPCWTYASLVTRTYKSSGQNCDTTIKSSWPAIRRLAKTAEGRTWLNNQFVLCNDSKIKSEFDADQLVTWLTNCWGDLAMIDYPYATNFLSPVPGWPVKEACKFMTNSTLDDKSLLTSIYKGISVYQNYTGKTKCYRVSADTSPKLGEIGWDFQACTEMVMPMCQNGSDMFEPSEWNLTQFSNKCKSKWYGADTRPSWAMTCYDGRMESQSNIIFSNGHLDPWSGGGVLSTSNPSIVTIYISDGAHHYDLRGANKDDTDAVKQARIVEKKWIKKWLHKQKHTHHHQKQNKKEFRF